MPTLVPAAPARVPGSMVGLKRYSHSIICQKNLIDHSLLFLCMDKHKRAYCVEVTFDGSNFQHLTGLETDPAHITPSHFFQLCLDRRLKESDFVFAKNGTADWKLDVLPRAFSKNLAANMIGMYNQSQPLLSTGRIAGSVSACLGFVRDGGGGRCIPNTVLKGDIRTLVHVPDRILVTYRKSSKEAAYTEIAYETKKMNWTELQMPAGYADLPLCRRLGDMRRRQAVGPQVRGRARLRG